MLHMDLTAKVAETKDEKANQQDDAVSPGMEPKTQQLFADGIRQTIPEAVKLASEILDWLPRLLAAANGNWTLAHGMTVEETIRQGKDQLKAAEARCLEVAAAHERNVVELDQLQKILDREPKDGQLTGEDAETVVNAVAFALYNTKALIGSVAWLAGCMPFGSALLGLDGTDESLNVIVGGVCTLYMQDNPGAAAADCPACKLRALAAETVSAFALQRLVRNMLLGAMARRLAGPGATDATINAAEGRIVDRARDIEAAKHSGPSH